jgi:hypothetical protein
VFPALERKKRNESLPGSRPAGIRLDGSKQAVLRVTSPAFIEQDRGFEETCLPGDIARRIRHSCQPLERRLAPFLGNRQLCAVHECLWMFGWIVEQWAESRCRALPLASFERSGRSIKPAGFGPVCPPGRGDARRQYHQDDTCNQAAMSSNKAGERLRHTGCVKQIASPADGSC